MVRVVLVGLIELTMRFIPVGRKAPMPWTMLPRTRMMRPGVIIGVAIVVVC